jgi:hypothetical protein
MPASVDHLGPCSPSAAHWRSRPPPPPAAAATTTAVALVPGGGGGGLGLGQVPAEDLDDLMVAVDLRRRRGDLAHAALGGGVGA